MTSSHDESGDDTTSSLDDSAYDFIDDRSNVTTDDEDQGALTESTTSSDGQAFEQVERYEVGGGDGGVERPGRNHITATQHPSQANEAYSHFHDAGSLVSAISRQYGESDFIEFDEPSITNLNSSRFTEVSHTLKVVEREGFLPGLSENRIDRLPGQLAVTVRQTMTSHSLSPEGGQYKVLYLGDQSTRDQVMQKIGTAMAASFWNAPGRSEQSGSSKFNIVPISSFDEQNSPEVVLVDSSGLELIVEDCSHSSFMREEGGHDSLQLKLSDGRSVESTWTGSQFAIPNDWHLPDIAIFNIPSNDNSALKMTRQSARSFMSRHKVPSITISKDLFWEKPAAASMDLDYLTPHICLESRKSSIASAQIIRRFPIDLTTFMNIDAGQMNRNLACLAIARGMPKIQSQEKRIDTKDRPVRDAWTFGEICESLIDDVRKEGLKGLNRYEYIAGFVVVLISLLGMLVVGFGLAELLGASKATSIGFRDSRVSRTTDIPIIHAGTIYRPTPSSTVPLSLPNSSSVTASSPSSTTAEVRNPKSPIANTDLASSLLDAYILAPNKSQQFKVHVLGDCHIVLRPPQWLSNMKRAPKLFFKILRNDIEIEHQFKALFDGVSALQIHKQDAYGILGVKVWTESKPIINEIFEVDFGSSWLKAHGWKKATRMITKQVRDELQLAQNGLSIAYDQTKTSLSTFVQQQKRKVAAQKSTEKALLDTHLRAAARTKELIVAQTREVQRGFVKSVIATQRAVSKEVLGKARLTKDLIVYTRNTSARVRKQVRNIGCARKHKHIKQVVNRIGDFRRESLRESQKRVLKTWWVLKGLPKQKPGKTKCKKCKVVFG